MGGFFKTKWGFGLSILLINACGLFGDEVSLEPMVVVETRMEEPLSEISPWVTKISAKDLEKRQVYNLADALRSVPGMAVARTGQVGAQTSLFSRGAQSDHVTFLYEGRRLNGGFSGTYNLGQLSLSGVSSVEVLRGSSSVQYGAEGIGGAVLLRTESDGEGLNWIVEGGSNDSFLNSIDTSFKNSGWEGSANTSLYTTDNEQPFSQFDNHSSSFNLSRKLSENLEVNFLGIGFNSDVNYPGNNKSPFYPVQGQYLQSEGFLLSPGIKVKTGDFEVSSFYSYSEDDLMGKDSFSDTSYEAQTNSMDLQVNGEIFEDFKVILGGLYEKDIFHKQDNATSLVDIDKEADSRSVFALSTYSFSEATSITLGARNDRFSDYGSESTWSTLLEHDIFENLSLVTRFSTSFSPPQANDLYGMWGNSNLKPEKAESWEIGMVANPNQALRIRLSYFETKFEDLIDFDPVLWIPVNIGSARSHGFESSLEAIHGNFLSRLSFSYLDAENSSTNERLLRRPKILGHLVMQHSNELHTLGLGLKLIQDVMDIDGGTFLRIQGDDYAVLRLFGDYRITEHIKLFGRIENLLDEEYDEVDGYPAPSRGIYGGLGFSF